MISLIIGHKGSGKTKLLVDEVNSAVEKSNGSVVCVEKETKLTYDVKSSVSLVATTDVRSNSAALFVFV